MHPTKVLQKAKKLKTMWQRGSYKGERDNAKEMLDAYMAKHNITMEEIDGYKLTGKYVHMSDADFMKEIKLELLIVGLGYGLGYIFGLFDKKDKQYDAYKENLNKKTKELGKVIMERYQVKTNKK